MQFKVNSLNPFDKKFFGKSMAAWSNRKSADISNPVKMELSSIDDFNKHFMDKIFGHKLERSPKSDTFLTDIDTNNMSWIYYSKINE